MPVARGSPARRPAYAPPIHMSAKRTRDTVESDVRTGLVPQGGRVRLQHNGWLSDLDALNWHDTSERVALEWPFGKPICRCSKYV